jgi:hypothetical protein
VRSTAATRCRPTRKRWLTLVLTLLAAAALSAQELTGTARLAFIRRAQIWAPTNVSAMDLRAGPRGPGAVPPGEMVTCEYVERALPGTTRKFFCAVSPGDVVKVRYGPHNGEVEGAVLATRLLWALGFSADRVYPARVACRGCSSDPWTKRKRVAGEQVFDPAAIERKPDGREMRYHGKDAGWAWTDLDLVEPSQGGAPAEQRDALKLLAVFMQHTDTKPYQQRLLCAPGGVTDTEACDKPFMVLHDVGVTFGRANAFNRNVTGSVNYEEWSKTPIWRDGTACIGRLSKSVTGTLGDPAIGEGGRKFLADLLVQLSDRQLRDLFEVARVDLRRHGAGGNAAATIEEWVAAFKHKRDEIVTRRCSSEL